MAKNYVVHLTPTIDGTGKDMPNTFEIEADRFDIEEGVAVFRAGAIVAAFPPHSYRAVVLADKPDAEADAIAETLSGALHNAAEA